MRVEKRAGWIAAGIAALAVLAVGGCPVVSDGLTGIGAPSASAAPGDYWVDVHDGKVSYFALSTQRGVDGAWVTIADAYPEWYVTPGVYRYDVQTGWARVADSSVATLDELVQLNDPAPAVP